MAMIGKRRGRLEIIEDILRMALHAPCLKYQLMDRVVLSYDQIQIYLPLLIGKGLLKVDSNKEGNLEYETTEKGRGFLEAIATIKQLFSENDLKQPLQTLKCVGGKVVVMSRRP